MFTQLIPLSKLFYVTDALFIIKKLAKNSHNFIITCQDPFETGIVGAFAKMFFNLPLHVQVHTDLMNKYFRQTYFLNRIRYFMAEFVLKYSDRVRVVSERIKKSIDKFSKNIDVLPIKVKIETESGEKIKKPFAFTLLMVCRLEKEKNMETVFQTVKNLNNKNIGLCIVGDGSQKEILKQTAKDLGISDRVIFAGWQDDLAPYYKIADVFVSSSLYEGYGISTMEAAYFEKPLILSDTGVAGEIFKNNESAFVCDAKDGACFAEKVLNIYQDKNLAQKIGQSAKLAADKHLNSERDYFYDYADSVLKTANGFKKRNFISRIFYFKKTVFQFFYRFAIFPLWHYISNC